MRKDVAAIILILIGGAVLRITIGGSYLNYVKEVMEPFLLASGGLLVLLGVLALLDVFRASRVSAEVVAADQQLEDELDGHVHGHDHSQGPRVAWLMLLPVLAIFLIAPPALGAFTAAREVNNTIAPPAEAKAPPLPAGDPVEVTLADYVGRAVWDDGLTLDGRIVEMTGFVTPDPAGGWWLTRMSMACCAADAIGTRIKVVDTPDLPANTWIVVTGSWVPGGGTQESDAIPLLRIESLQQIDQPRNPYE
jgi:uncharacterized repeat protein (TIGR03943 family)